MQTVARLNKPGSFPPSNEKKLYYKEIKILNYKDKNKTPWPESASELYRQTDRRLSAKLVPTFADRGCHVVSVMDPYGLILDFLDRKITNIKKLKLCIHFLIHIRGVIRLSMEMYSFTILSIFNRWEWSASSSSPYNVEVRAPGSYEKTPKALGRRFWCFITGK
jgi:hypothetical protein